jgi:hypothetical protein
MDQQRASHASHGLSGMLGQMVLVLLLGCSQSQFNALLNTALRKGFRSKLTAGVRANFGGVKEANSAGWRMVCLVLVQSCHHSACRFLWQPVELGVP